MSEEAKKTEEVDGTTFEDMVEAVQPISAKTITSFIVTVVAVVNMIALTFGKDLGLKIDEGSLYQLVSSLMLVGATAWSWWRNNDVTKHARKN